MKKIKNLPIDIHEFYGVIVGFSAIKIDQSATDQLKFYLSIITPNFKASKSDLELIEENILKTKNLIKNRKLNLKKMLDIDSIEKLAFSFKNFINGLPLALCLPFQNNIPEELNSTINEIKLLNEFDLDLEDQNNFNYFDDILEYLLNIIEY
ncbi:MAG: hypothetical protein R3Y52_01385, partial [Psittacicella sp.]